MTKQKEIKSALKRLMTLKLNHFPICANCDNTMCSYPTDQVSKEELKEDAIAPFFIKNNGY